jgi:pimeloyl-ACP methyl ester carboxylesterase
MQIVDRGSGAPLVLIPGIQGRWEYLGPTIDALSASFRVITFPLRGEPGSDASYDPAGGLDNYVEQAIGVLDTLHIDRAIVCGISFGGLVALRIAACRPGRVASLILASTPGPSWRPAKRHMFYARMPRLLGPLFLAETPWRLRGEVSKGFWKLARVLKTPLSLTRMAQRGVAISTADTLTDCARITAPTLVVTGERALDRIVPVDGSVDYLRLISNAQHIVIDGAGHLGYVTQPGRFAKMVEHFAATPERESLRSSARSSASGGGAPRASNKDHHAA